MNAAAEEQAAEGRPGGGPSAPEPPRAKALVSACLLGCACRYDGSSNEDGRLRAELGAEDLEAVPFCPEEAGGLGTPRPPAWLERGAGAVLDGAARVVTDAGVDVTRAFVRGAELALATCRAHAIRRAFLKERSPSCGVRATHADGRLVEGPGVTAELLRRHGIDVTGVEGRRRPA